VFVFNIFFGHDVFVFTPRFCVQFQASSWRSLILKVCRGAYPPLPNRLPYELQYLLKQMFKTNPKDRPSLHSILTSHRVSRLLRTHLPSQVHTTHTHTHTHTHSCALKSAVPLQFELSAYSWTRSVFMAAVRHAVTTPSQCENLNSYAIPPPVWNLAFDKAVLVQMDPVAYVMYCDCLQRLESFTGAGDAGTGEA